MKTIIYLLICICLSTLGCIDNTYVGTYSNGGEIVKLFDDGTYYADNTKYTFSGDYKIDGDNLYLTTWLGSKEFLINETSIYDTNGWVLYKQ